MKIVNKIEPKILDFNLYLSTAAAKTGALFMSKSKIRKPANLPKN